MKVYIELTKPRVVWLILVSTGIGFWYGAPANWQWAALLHTLLGTALIAGGTFTINQWMERDGDVRMNRTKMRPIPTGRVGARPALIFGVVLSVIGSLELYLGANPLSCLLGLLTEATYLGLYTPLKRKSWHSTTVGSIPGAMPPLIGFAASAGTLTLEAWVLFAILLLWQFPHFYAIAWMYREDYAKAGIRMLPVVEPDGASTARQILLASLLLMPVSLLPSFLMMAGWTYFFGMTLAGAYFLYACFGVFLQRTSLQARAVLMASVIYLPILYGLLILDRAVS